MFFTFQKLRAPGNSAEPLIREVGDGHHYQGQLWGVFNGYFGLARNELFVISASEDNPAGLIAASPFAVAAQSWSATARPTSIQPCSTPGLYVFRRFHVKAEDVDEVVQLSREAWQTFEHTKAYAAEPKGLFRPPADEAGIVKLMLVTWYDGFASWQISRQPDPAAQDNFRRRHALTLTTYAIATQLVDLGQAESR